MFFFSVPPEKKQPKRELVARSGQNKSYSSKLCCGTRFAQTVLALLSASFFSRRICYLPSRYRN